MPEGEQEISWTVQTHEHKERSTDWYWALGTVVLVGAGVSIFFGNILLAAIIIIATGSLGVLAARGPREHSVRIDRRGISIDGTFYPYASVHSFWIERLPAQAGNQAGNTDRPRLFLSMKGVLSPHFTLPLPGHMRAEDMEKYLKQHAAEEEQGPHVGEHLAELLGL